MRAYFEFGRELCESPENFSRRYQKKIGTYDKQPWEQSVEQRILNGFVNIPSKNIISNTQYIDVDLVRGLLSLSYS